MCQLYNTKLSKYLMNLTNTFCREKLQQGVPRLPNMKRQQSASVVNLTLIFESYMSSFMSISLEREYQPVNRSTFGLGV